MTGLGFSAIMRSIEDHWEEKRAMEAAMPALNGGDA
jgi:hypothetical protein